MQETSKLRKHFVSSFCLWLTALSRQGSRSEQSTAAPSPPARGEPDNQHYPAVLILTSVSKTALDVEPSDKETMSLILRMREKTWDF